MSGFDDIFLPHRLEPDWLGEALSDALLDYAIARQADFTPSEVITKEGSTSILPVIRKSWRLPDLGPCQAPFEDRIRQAVPDLEARLGRLRGGVKTLFIELAAHGDGAHFLPHMDTHTGPWARTRATRRISLITYLHRRPKAFSGGQLRLFSLSGERHQDIEPDHGLMVAFPSWAQHSVQPVSVPSGAFADSRFAVNVWVYDQTRGAREN
jgi:Rps23 Pro-64 3,4-dihydroxylase Tpa1-like proline 4-hydroxylase